jgi:curved DNA-binding protein CbpA
METMRQQQHRQAVQPLLGVSTSSSTRSTSTTTMSFPADHETSSSQPQLYGGGDDDSYVWILSQGSWKKNYTHHHAHPETRSYSTPQMTSRRSASPTKRGAGGISSGDSISSRDSASSPTLFQKKLNKRNLYQRQQPKTSAAAAVEAEQRDAAFLGPERGNNIRSSEKSFFDEAIANTSTGGGVSDNDRSTTRSSFSERLEHVSKLTERNRNRNRSSPPQKRSPPAPSPSSASSTSLAVPPEAAPRRSSPLRQFMQSSSSSTGGGASTTATTTTRRAMSPNKALFLRKRRQKTTSTSSSSKRKDEPVAAQQPQPRPPPPQQGAPSSRLTTQTLRQHRSWSSSPSSSGNNSNNKGTAMAREATTSTTPTPTTTLTPEQPPCDGGGGGGSSSNSSFSRKSRFGRSRSFSGSIAAAPATATPQSTTPPQPLLLRSPSMSKNHGRIPSSWTPPHNDDDYAQLQQRSSSSSSSSNENSHKDDNHVVAIVPARVAPRNQRKNAKSYVVSAVVVAAMPRSPSNSPPRVDKKDLSSPAAVSAADHGGGGGGGTSCSSPTEEEVPLLVVDSNSSSSDTSSSSDGDVACWETKKRSVIPASRVQSIHAAFGHDCDLYKDVLQVSRDATDAQIRIAYFRRGRQVLAGTTKTIQGNAIESKKRNKNRRGSPNNSATVMADLPVSQKERFQAVSLAYEILCKASWKQEYDTYGWKLAALHTSSTLPPTPIKADCTVTTSTTITDIPGIKITSTTSTAEDTPSPYFVSYRMESSRSSSSRAASSEHASSILRNPSPANVPAASCSNVSQSDRCSVAGNSISRTRIRWSEEVEELVYRQDPEESRFKLRGSHSYDEDDSASGSEGSASSATSSTGSRCYDDGHSDHDDVAAAAAAAPAQVDSKIQKNENLIEGDRMKINESGNSIQGGEETKGPKTKTRKKMIVVDSDSIQRRLAKLEKKTFDNTFVTAFLNDIDRSLDGLEDSFDGMFGRKQRHAEMDDDDDDDGKIQLDSCVKPVSEKKQEDSSPSAKRLAPAKFFPSSPLTVVEGADDDNDSTVLHLFSELTKPARVLFHNTVVMSDDSPSPIAKAPANKSSPSKTPAADRRMTETERAFSPILHQEKSPDPFGFTDAKTDDFEDAFDPFNDSFQAEAIDEDEEKKGEPFRPVTKADAVGEFHSCSTPSCSVQLNKEPLEPLPSEPFTLHHGSTRNRVPLRPSTPNPSLPPPPHPATATATYNMDTSSPSSPIRGDTIFPRTHSGLSSLTGPASIYTTDTDIMLKEAEGNGVGLCTSLLEHSKDGTESKLGMKNGRAAKKQSEETHDFFGHFISYMDALSKDFQKFSQGPCRVVDEATQVIIDAVVIPEENLESMLAAFHEDGPPTCTNNNSPSSCAENSPAMTRSYTL